MSFNRREILPYKEYTFEGYATMTMLSGDTTPFDYFGYVPNYTSQWSLTPSDYYSKVLLEADGFFKIDLWNAYFEEEEDEDEEEIESLTINQRTVSPNNVTIGNISPWKTFNILFSGYANWVNHRLTKLIFTKSPYIDSNIDGSGMFSNLSNLEELDISCFDTSKFESFSTFFEHCEKLSKIELPKKMVTSACSNISYMFNLNPTGYSSNLFDEFDFSDWDVSNINSLGEAFHNLRVKKLILANWNVTNMTNMACEFCGTGNTLNHDWQLLDVSGWDMSHNPSGKWHLGLPLDSQLIIMCSQSFQNWAINNNGIEFCSTVRYIDKSTFVTQDYVNQVNSQWKDPSWKGWKIID